MNPILYSSTESSYTTNGLGRLSDAISCVITEERNGIFELEMEYPITGAHYSEIEEERILFAQPRPGGTNQAFRIYKISRPISGRVTISARHISYQLNKITVKPFQAESCVSALNGLKTNSIGSNPFEFWTDKSVIGTFTVDKPSTIRSLLGGQAGSILDTFGTAEYEWDMYTVKLHQNRGHDNGVTLRYGKNITDLTNIADTGSVYTGIVPFWASADNVVTLPEFVLYGPHRSEYPYDMVVPVDLSSRWQEAPTVAQLRSAANAYLNSSTGWQINTNLKVSFVNLADTEEYREIATLQRVNLCDTVKVIHEQLGVEASAKVVKTVFNVLMERYDSIELGSSRTSLSEAISESILEEVPTSSDMAQAIARGTKLITGGLGGYVYLKPNANGQPEEILVMDDPDYTQATKLWRFNKNGIGYSNTGYNGTYKQAWTIDGEFYTDWVTAGKMTATLIKTGIITGQKGSMQIDVDNGVITLGNKSLVVTAGNFKLDADGNLEITGKVTATSGKIGQCTIGDGIQYGKTSIDDVGVGMYLGPDGFAVGQNGRYTGFKVRADGTPVANYLKFQDNAGHESSYGLWCDSYGRIGTGGAIWTNQEHQTAGGGNYIMSPSIIDGYQRIDSDRRIKDKIRYLTPDEATEFVMALKPAEFVFSDDFKKDQPPGYWDGIRHGFIAQDVREALGEHADKRSLVAKNTYNDMYELRYDELTADLVGICQKQQQRIDELEQRLKTIESLLEGDGK